MRVCIAAVRWHLWSPRRYEYTCRTAVNVSAGLWNAPLVILPNLYERKEYRSAPLALPAAEAVASDVGSPPTDATRPSPQQSRRPLGLVELVHSLIIAHGAQVFHSGVFNTVRFAWETPHRAIARFP